MLPSERAAAAQRELESKLASLTPDQREQSVKLMRKLISLGFAAEFMRLESGPIVQTFYYKPLGDVQFKNILNKEEEIAGTLAVESVIITRELGEVSISVPRADRQVINFDSCLHTMLSSKATRDMALPLLLGQSKTGENLYADLAAQPHMLIAGATNSGKSVFTAQLISSLALFRSPEELEFILVDTKNLDLVLFKGLEHVKYVLSSIEDIRTALSQLLAEVRLRNTQMSGLVRNIREWNGMQALPQKKLVYKILIMDELADVVDQDEDTLRRLKRNERPPSILELIKTIAQISRAAGIHLVLATQRPSVDILPGSIKTNFPARVSFKLPTRTDSQVILDSNGAENLLGAGDYLYKIAGSDTLKRGHSAYISMTNIAMLLSQHEMIRKQYEQMETA